MSKNGIALYEKSPKHRAVLSPLGRYWLVLSLILAFLGLAFSVRSIYAASDVTKIGTDGDETTYAIGNEREYSLKFIKMDKDTGVTISGGSFELYKGNLTGTSWYGASCVGIKSADENGIISFTGLEKGEYTLVEREAPFGYPQGTELDAFPVFHAETGTTKAISGYKIYNKKAVLKMKKIDKDSGEAIASGKFQLYDPFGKKVGSAQTPDENGVLTWELPYLNSSNPYVVREEETPSGYIKDSTAYKWDRNNKKWVKLDSSSNYGQWEITITSDYTENYGLESLFEITNEAYATLKFTKIDSETGTAPNVSSSDLAKFRFQLREGSGKDGKVLLEDLKLDATGVLQINNITPGEYHLEETAAPDGYKVNSDGWDVKAPSGGIGIYNLPNTPLYKIQIKKTGSSGQQALSGGEFVLHKGNKDGDMVATENLKDGYVTFENIEPGNYHITETKAPAGMDINKKGWDITVSAGSAEEDRTISLDFVDDSNFTNFKLRLKKTDSSTGDTISGGLFTLYNAERLSTEGEIGDTVIKQGKVYSTTADADGMISFREIKSEGYYYLEETEAPDGYQKDETGWIFYLSDGKWYYGKTISEVEKSEGFDATSSGEYGTITNTPESKFRIKKIDGSLNPIEGAVFEFTADELDSSLRFKTGKSGYINITKLQSGVEYTMTEAEVPLPYIKTTASWKVVYDSDTNTVKITDENGKVTTYDCSSDDDQKTYEITNAKFPEFKKVDGLTNKAIAGAEFAILTEDQYNNYVDTGLLPGESGEDEEATKSYTVSVITDPETEYDYDVDTGKETYTYPSGTYTGDGAYTEGTTANVSWEAKSGHTLKHVWVDGKEVTEEYPDGITFSNIKDNHIIRLVFDDAEDVDADYSDDAKTPWDGYFTGISGDDGYITLSAKAAEGESTPELGMGTYYLVETEAASGYDKDTFTAKRIVIYEGDDNEAKIAVYNGDTLMEDSDGVYTLKNVRSGSLNLYKTDTKGNPLEGAEFTLSGTSASGDSVSITKSSSQETVESDTETTPSDGESEDPNVTQEVTKKTGNVIFDSIPEGYDYTLKEIVPANGKLDSDGNLDTKAYKTLETTYHVQVITQDSAEVKVGSSTKTLTKGTYLYDENWNLLTANSDGKYVIKNERTVSLGVIKYNTNGGAPMSDVDFTLKGTADDGTSVNAVETTGYGTGTSENQAGFARWDDLKDGTYTLTENETTYTDYFNIAIAGPWTITIKDGDITMKDADGNTVEESDYYGIGVQSFMIGNSIKPDFIINKVDEEGNAIEGAEFTLTKDGTKLTETSDENGVVKFSGLDFGTYTLKETKFPSGYGKGNTEWTVTVSPYVAKDEYYSEAEGVKITTTGGITIKEKDSGKEIKTDNNNYRTSNTVSYDYPFEFFIAGKYYFVNGETYSGTNTNIQLVDEDGLVDLSEKNDPYYRLTDASGNILKEESLTKASFDLASLGLQKGQTYYLTVELYPKNMKARYYDYVQTIAIVYGGDKDTSSISSQEVTLTNKKLTENFKIKKVATGTTDTIEGATFQIWDKKKTEDGAKLLKEGTTDKNGEIDFGEINPAESLYIYETETPLGYTAPTEGTFWNITNTKDSDGYHSLATLMLSGTEIRTCNYSYETGDDGTITGTLTIENEPEGWILPNTGGKGILMMICMGLMFVLIGVEYKIIQKKRK